MPTAELKERKPKTKKLAEQECKPCKEGGPALKGGQIEEYFDQLSKGWDVVEEHQLEKEYKFKDFKTALDFVNKVGDLAETANHHPDVFLAWGQVKLTLWTHSAGGLTESDFVFAAKVDKIKK